MPNKKAETQQEAAVVGAGPAGLAAAIILAEAGIETTLVGKPTPAKSDNRTTALLAGSVTALETLGVWSLCAAQAAPLRVMRIVDDTGRLWRAPEVRFEAHEIDLKAFGYNIENRHLIAALKQRTLALPSLRVIDDEVLSVASDDTQVTITLKNGGRLAAPLVIGADGRHSLCRAAAHIELETRQYRQIALTVCFKHTHPHNDTSTEFHTPSGPFTIVPLPGNRSSLVWVVNAADADTIATQDDNALAKNIERGSHSILGKIEVDPGRGMFPLSVTRPDRFANKRVVLVGEAAHVIPPIGAQGLNLGLRDAATIGELAVHAYRAEADIGGEDVLTRYDRMRRTDVGSRTIAVDLLNRSLLTDFLPVQGMRGLGLYLLDRIGPLRRAIMREGIASAMAQPKLMRGETL